jgi:hypothetical protein
MSCALFLSNEKPRILMKYFPDPTQTLAFKITQIVQQQDIEE